jgi:F-type H+-transporting ATPase subunit delta
LSRLAAEWYKVWACETLRKLTEMTSKTAATRYARALLDVAIKEHANLEEVEQQLVDFAGLLTEHPTLRKVLVNPAVPVQRKVATVDQLVPLVKISPIVSKLIRLLAERDRLILLPELVASYRDRLADHRLIVRADVTTAIPLPAERAAEIQESLARVTGRTVTLQTRVDPAIIGGMVARVGSVVYDASVTRQLQKMRDRLVESAT